MRMSQKTKSVLKSVDDTKISKFIVIHVDSSDGSVIKRTFHNDIEEARAVFKKVNDTTEETGIWAYITCGVIE